MILLRSGRTSSGVRPPMYENFHRNKEFWNIDRFWTFLPLVNPFWEFIFGSARFVTYFIFKNLSGWLKKYFIAKIFFPESELELYYTIPGYLIDCPSISISWGEAHISSLVQSVHQINPIQLFQSHRCRNPNYLFHCLLELDYELLNLLQRNQPQV